VVLRKLVPLSAFPEPFPAYGIFVPNEKNHWPSAHYGVYQPLPTELIDRALSGVPPSDYSAVVLATHSPTNDPAKAKREAEDLFKRVFPFLVEATLAQDILVEEEAHAAYPHFVSPTDNCSLLQGRSIFTPAPNLFRAGRDVAPTLGIDGEIAIAFSLVSAISKQLKRKHDWAITERGRQQYLNISH
jgi:hypothetical protein